ncbi:hypothetical protein [Helicobacter pylori]|uniref:hypothetical protein n=1 Tax=Helicobacter pylori TaxID=210 RepID=UPI000EAE65A3|nr:hypothetical protein [Helicobacter pylori]
MWYSKNSDGYTYNVKNNGKGAYEAILIEFFHSNEYKIKIRKEKKADLIRCAITNPYLNALKKQRKKKKTLPTMGHALP